MEMFSPAQQFSDFGPQRVRRLANTSLLLVLSTPLVCCIATYWCPESAGRQLVLGLSGPMFIAVCMAALWYSKHLSEKHPTILFSMVCLIYLGEFGLRALYLALFPDLVTFPNVDPIHDQLSLHRALMWGLLGVLAMTLAYFRKQGAARGIKPGFPRVQSRLADRVRRASTPEFLIVLYLLGWTGRAYMIYTGSIYWFYNSPNFDLVARRPNPYIAGPLSLFSEFCPIAFGGLTSLVFSRSWRLLQYILFAAMLSAELFYFSLGLYKFGMIGALLIPVVTLWLNRRQFPWKMGILMGAVVVGAVLPVTNALRSSNEYLRDITSLRPSLDMARAVPGETEEVYSGQHLNVRYFADQLFERLNGAEALIVAEKLTSPDSYYWGATYLNVVKLAVPRLLRLWSSDAFYIPWETDYVGRASHDPTVVPMPMLIEAFLNFGIVGVVVMMALVGYIYRAVDSAGALCSASALGTGTYAYVVWRVTDIELNFFGIFLAPLKAILLLLFFVWLWGKVVTPRKSGILAQ